MSQRLPRPHMDLQALIEIPAGFRGRLPLTSSSKLDQEMLRVMPPNRNVRVSYIKLPVEGIRDGLHICFLPHPSKPSHNRRAFPVPLLLVEALSIAENAGVFSQSCVRGTKVSHAIGGRRLVGAIGKVWGWAGELGRKLALGLATRWRCELAVFGL